MARTDASMGRKWISIFAFDLRSVFDRTLAMENERSPIALCGNSHFSAQLAVRLWRWSKILAADFHCRHDHFVLSAHAMVAQDSRKKEEHRVTRGLFYLGHESRGLYYCA